MFDVAPDREHIWLLSVHCVRFLRLGIRLQCTHALYVVACALCQNQWMQSTMIQQGVTREGIEYR